MSRTDPSQCVGAAQFKDVWYCLRNLSMEPKLVTVRTTVDLLVAVEDYRDGRAVPALGWDGQVPTDGPRYFSGFRLFAQRLEAPGSGIASPVPAGANVQLAENIMFSGFVRDTDPRRSTHACAGCAAPCGALPCACC